MKDKILVVIGKSASGKDAIVKELCKLANFNFVVSTTSRPMREGETNGKSHYFVDENEFKQLIKNDELIEYRIYNTLTNDIPTVWYYGITKDSIDNVDRQIAIVDMKGLKSLKNLYGDRIVSFYIHVDDKTRTEWAKKRGGYDKSEWERRLIDDEKVFNKEDLKENVDYIIENEILSKTVRKILKKINEL